jgi:hypothetical protein
MNIENNIILNEFVGLRPKLESPDVYTFAKMPFFSCRHYTPEEVIKSIAEYTKYDQDWNLIMDVVEKIESLGYDVFINTCVCRITDVGQNMFEDIECFVNDNKRQATYNACVEFVEWYNNQK